MISFYKLNTAQRYGKLHFSNTTLLHLWGSYASIKQRDPLVDQRTTERYVHRREREKYLALPLKKRKRQFLAGRVFSKRLIAQMVRECGSIFRVRYNQIWIQNIEQGINKGMPVLITPDDALRRWSISISHISDSVFTAATNNGRVGVDVENIFSPSQASNTLGIPRVELIIDTLCDSLFLSGLGIFIVCGLLFRSIAGGLLNLFTVTISLLINFAIMGLMGVDIAVGTSFVSAIIIGIGVDFSIHIIAKYQLILKTETSWFNATEKVLETLGVTLFISAIVIIFGFLVLVSSQLPPTKTVGLLVATAMFSSFLASVIFLPVLILITKPLFIAKTPSKGIT